MISVSVKYFQMSQVRSIVCVSFSVKKKVVVLFLHLIHYDIYLILHLMLDTFRGDPLMLLSHGLPNYKTKYNLKY